MLTTLLSLVLATATTTPETMTALAKAQADVTAAQTVLAECWTPRECIAARELATAAEDALSAARTLAGAAAVAAEVDPFAPPSEAYCNPFRDDWPPFAGTPLPSAADVAAMIAEGETLATSEVQP